MNKRLKIGPCSRECAIERSLDGVTVNESLVKDMLFSEMWPSDASVCGDREQET